MALLSNEGRDKLIAALNYDAVDVSPRLPLVYIQACTLWYGALSPLDKMLVTACRAEYARGYADQAAIEAEALPPAPKWPL